jgi:hypothetical protein
MAAVTKSNSDLCSDAYLDYVATSTIQIVLSDMPATYAEAAATYDLATHVMSSGDYAKADGTVNGRKLTIAAQAAITVDHNGTATGVFLGISGSSAKVWTTTCTSQGLVAANTVTIPAWTITVADVAA